MGKKNENKKNDGPSRSEVDSIANEFIKVVYEKMGKGQYRPRNPEDPEDLPPEDLQKAIELYENLLREATTYVNEGGELTDTYKTLLKRGRELSNYTIVEAEEVKEMPEEVTEPEEQNIVARYDAIIERTKKLLESSSEVGENIKNAKAKISEIKAKCAELNAKYDDVKELMESNHKSRMELEEMKIRNETELSIARTKFEQESEMRKLRLDILFSRAQAVIESADVATGGK